MPDPIILFGKCVYCARMILIQRTHEEWNYYVWHKACDERERVEASDD